MSQHNGSIVQNNEYGAIQTFMAQIYGWMSVGLLLTAFVAWFAIPSDFTAEALYSSLAYKVASNSALKWGLIIAQFGAVIVLSAMLTKISSSVATFLFMLYSALTGLTLSVLVLVYTKESIASTLFITAGTFAAISVYGYVTKKDLTKFGSFLLMGLIGIVIASVVNLFVKSSTVSLVVSYIGVLVFIGLTAYDTQKLKVMGEQFTDQHPNSYRKYAIIGALTLYLDFINLFIMLLNVLGDRRN